MADEPVGETPFNAEERVEVRKMLRMLKSINEEDVVEIKKIAQGGKVLKAAMMFIAWFVGAITGALVLFNTIKQFLGKGGG